jgi:broad specificity phosphatase PhoE
VHRADLRITLVRHGETTGQSSIRYYGATDIPLSPPGEEQMRRVAAALAGDTFDRVLTSKLHRSRRAAEIIAPDGPTPVPIARFNEVNFGDWEGLTRDEIAERDPRTYEIWQGNKDAFRYPGGESRLELSQRVVSGLRQELDTQPGGRWLMPLHRGVIAVILTHLLELDPEQRHSLSIDLGSIHQIFHRDGTWHTAVLDRVDHLR